MKKKAKEELVDMLQRMKGEISIELNRNKRELTRLVDKQTTQKRKLVEINKIIYGLRK